MMIVPFLDLQQQYLELQNELDMAALRVLKSGWYVLGHECESFEENFSSYLGGSSGNVVSVNSGTDAIKLSLLAAGVQSGDEVITVANTAIPTVTAICSVGAIPVFCDVDPETWLIDPSLLEACVSERTRAIVLVHLYGAVCDLDRISEFASRHKLTVVEDVAQSCGAEWNGSKCGTLGDYGAFSFYPTKNLGACGDGGAIFVRDKGQADILKQLRNYGQSCRYNATLASGENSRLDELQAALLSVKLPFLDRWNNCRRTLSSKYRQELTDRGLSLTWQRGISGAEPAPHLFVVAVDANQRDLVMLKMSDFRVQTLCHYPMPLYKQDAFNRFYRQSNPVSEGLCQRVLSLPFHQYLREDTVTLVCERLEKVINSIELDVNL